MKDASQAKLVMSYISLPRVVGATSTKSKKPPCARRFPVTETAKLR